MGLLKVLSCRATTITTKKSLRTCKIVSDVIKNNRPLLLVNFLSHIEDILPYILQHKCFDKRLSCKHKPKENYKQFHSRSVPTSSSKHCIYLLNERIYVGWSMLITHIQRTTTSMFIFFVCWWDYVSIDELVHSSVRST